MNREIWIDYRNELKDEVNVHVVQNVRYTVWLNVWRNIFISEAFRSTIAIRDQLEDYAKN